MNPILTKLKKLPTIYLGVDELAYYLDGTQDSRQSLIKRAVASGLLIRVKRGLYCLSDYLTNRRAHPFELAYRIYPPSVVSCESALAYYGLIPESVVTTTSVTPLRQNQFTTPLGVFHYKTVPKNRFMTSVRCVKEGDLRYFIASPWRAITDYVYCYKKNWIGYAPLFGSLRMDEDELLPLTEDEMLALIHYFKSRRVTQFLRSIYKEQQDDHYDHTRAA